MPIIETKGAASAQGFGLFTSKPIPVDGTKGIFNIGAESPTRNRYTFACDTNASITGFPAPNTSTAGMGAGNTTKIIFALGQSPIIGPSPTGGRTNVRYTYTYACCANSPAPNLPTVTGGGAAVGNSTRGIFANGNTGAPPGISTTRSKFTYACCSNAPAAASSAATQQLSAAGNSTRGLFKFGYQCQTGPLAGKNGYSITFNKYTYACDTSTTSGVGTARYYSRLGAATGNATRGIFHLGGIICATPGFPSGRANTVFMCKYTYACDTRAAATDSGGASSSGSAAGNSTRGIFAAGIRVSPTYPGGAASNNRCKYTYSTDTRVSATASSAVSYCGSAASFATCVNT